MHYKASRRKQPTVVPGFPCTDNVVLREFDTLQICEVLRASIAASAYTSKWGPIKKLVTLSFGALMTVVTLLNGYRFLRLVLEPNRRKTEPFRDYDHPDYIRGHRSLLLLAHLQRRVTEQDADVASGLPFRYFSSLLCAALAQGLEEAD